MNAKRILIILFILKLSLINGDSVKSSNLSSEPKHHLHRHQSQQNHHHRSVYRNHTKHNFYDSVLAHHSDKNYLNGATTKSKSRYSAEDLLSNKFPTHISNDIDMDPCKSGKFLHSFIYAVLFFFSHYSYTFNLLFISEQ